MEDMDGRLAALLMADAKKGVKLYVTPCVLAELERIGPEYAGNPSSIMRQPQNLFYVIRCCRGQRI